MAARSSVFAPHNQGQSLPIEFAISGVAVWVREGDAWVLGELVESADDVPGVYSVKLDKKKTVKRPLNELLGANDVNPSECVDLTKLLYIHDAAVNDMLRQRFTRAYIYTNVGAMLLVLNPYRDLKLTTPDKVLHYRKATKDQLRNAVPHVYAVSAKALHHFRDTDEGNISFVISGESGAGKTETTKHILSFFTLPADGDDEKKDPVSSAIMAGNPILEAFGNATTCRNNNSSRFGRLVKLYIDVETLPDGSPIAKINGGDVSPYLLERSRVSNAAENERSYHVFYMMLKSMTTEELVSMRLPTAWKTLNMLGGKRLTDVPGAAPDHDQKDWAEMLEAFDKIDLSEEEKESIPKILAGCLLLMEIQLQPKGDTEECEAKNPQRVKDVEYLLSLPEDAAGVGFFQAVTSKYFVIDGKETPSPLKIRDATQQIGCVCRSVYDKLFLYLISKINAAVKLEGDHRWCAVLDIFGFEIMDINSLEQMLINYANERLQQFFIANVFRSEREEYEREGIDPSCVSYEDNAALLAVIDNASSKAGPLGILEELNSACKSGTGNDSTFLNAVKKAGYPDDFIAYATGKQSEMGFYMLHTSNKVCYTTEGWRDKNMERLSDKIREAFSVSTSEVIQALFSDGGDAAKFTGAAFKASISSLLTTLGDSSPYFIRCIKPNTTKMPQDWNYRVVKGQLQSLSVLDALQLAQKGYPFRCEYEKFLKDNYVLRMVYQPTGETPEDETIDLIEKIQDIPESDYKKGLTMLFLKKIAHRLLDGRIMKISRRCTDIAECAVRIVHSQEMQKIYLTDQSRAITMQAYVRGFRERLVITKKMKRLRVLWACTMWCFSSRRFKRDRLAAFTIQATLKELMAMERVKEMMINKMLGDGKNQLYIIVQVMLAQRKLQEAIARKQLMILHRTVKHVSQNWLQKEQLRRFWTWRFVVTPARREVARRIILITRIQALVRGIMVRAGKLGQRVKFAQQKARNQFMLNERCITIQRNAKAYLLARRFQHMWGAASIVQYYHQCLFDRHSLVQSSRAAVRIQKAFRAWLVRQIVAWEKLKVLVNAENAAVDITTRQMRKRLVQLCGTAPLSLVSLTCFAELRSVYPRGWMHGYEETLKRDVVRKVVLGAEHTMVLGQKGVYAWGSDEVGQLGLGETTWKEKTEKTVIYNFVSPMLKHKVLDVASGRFHCVAHVEGHESVLCWGLNHRGQCGIKSYMQGAAFTANYPKIVRNPTPVFGLGGACRLVSAGAFASACILEEGVGGASYIWGENTTCGQAKDVRVPVRLGAESARNVVLGENCGFLLGVTGLLCFGLRSAILGIGAGPKQSGRNNVVLYSASDGYKVDSTSFCRHMPLIRFDTYSVECRQKLIPVPLPVRLPRVPVQAVCVGEAHVIAWVDSGGGGADLYEWGQRRIVRTDTCTDEGIVHLEFPVRLESVTSVVEAPGTPTYTHLQTIRAGGDMSVVIPAHPEPIAWSFLETTSRPDVLQPARVSFRLLKSAHRIELCSAPALFGVLGFNTAWKEPDLDRLLGDNSPTRRPRGGAQPMGGEISPTRGSPEKMRRPGSPTRAASPGGTSSPTRYAKGLAREQIANSPTKPSSSSPTKRDRARQRGESPSWLHDEFRRVRQGGKLVEPVDGWELGAKGATGWVDSGLPRGTRERQMFNVPLRSDHIDHRPEMDEGPGTAVHKHRTNAGSISPLRNRSAEPPIRRGVASPRGAAMRGLSPPVMAAVEGYLSPRSPGMRQEDEGSPWVISPSDTINRQERPNTPGSARRGRDLSPPIQHASEGRQRHKVLFELQQLLHGRPQRELEEMARILRSAGTE